VNHPGTNVNRSVNGACLALGLILAACAPASAAQIFSGYARTIAGDSLYVGDTEIDYSVSTRPSGRRDAARTANLGPVAKQPPATSGS
jgi:hypothetical protein